MASQDARLSKFEADFNQQQSEMTNKIDTMLKAITDRVAGILPSDTVKNPKTKLVPHSSNTKIFYSKEDDGKVMFIEIIRDDDEHQNEGPNEGNFTYVIDFMIVKDISSIIDPRLSQVVLGSPFIEISNMTHDLPEGVVRFTNENDEVSYKMPHKIEQYNSLSNLEKEHTKSVYLRNEEDKRRGVDYVMSKMLGFYKEFLELGPEYVTGLDDEGEVT
ncbi:hypothetical protein Tco_0285828 [Tanacetum coccineum]